MSTPDAVTTAQLRKAKDPARLGISRTLRRAVGGPDESAPKRIGRPTDYDPFMVAEAAGMAQMGATDAEICAAVGITHDTFYRWVRSVPGFSDAIKRGEVHNDRVERTLLQKALGGTKKTVTVDSDGRRVEKIEEVAGDTTAQIFWLKNRRRDRWADRQEHELVVPVDDSVSPEEQDTRKLALAMIALMNEAAEQPLTLDAVASYDQPMEADDGDQEDWAGEPEDLDV